MIGFAYPLQPPKNCRKSHRRVKTLNWLKLVNRFWSPPPKPIVDVALAAGVGIPTIIVLEDVLLRGDNSLAVVVARADGANVPVTVARNFSRIVCDAPAARLPTVQVFVVELNAVGADADTN